MFQLAGKLWLYWIFKFITLLSFLIKFSKQIITGIKKIEYFNIVDILFNWIIKLMEEKSKDYKYLKNIIRKLEGKIWEPQLIKKYYYKVSRKYIMTIKNIKILKWSQ